MQVHSWFAGQKHSSLLQVLLLTLTFEVLTFFRSTVKLRRSNDSIKTHIIDLRVIAIADGNVSEHLVDSLGIGKSDEGKVSWRGTDPYISHLREPM